MALGRKTGGRQKGTKNRRTLAKLKILEEEGITPLQYALRIMRDEKQPKERRDEMCKHALPFVHPRLTTTKVQGDKNAPLFDLTSLTDNELAFLRRTILKAQQVEEGE